MTSRNSIRFYGTAQEICDNCYVCFMRMKYERTNGKNTVYERTISSV